MKNLTIIALLLILSCKQTPQVSEEVQRWQAQAENVEIIRDDFGVPHIYGKTDADAVFGLLYAQCEDDFNRVERNYIWAIGRLAEVEGEDALYSDLRARLYMTKEEAIANYEKSPDWLKKLCDAFADGINYYLHSHPEVKPKLLTRFEPWMPMYFSEGSIGGDIEGISTRKIEAFYGKQPSSKMTAFNTAKEPFLEEEPAGSNGFAISGKHTKSGDAMLLINPHTSFFFRGEVHVVSEEGHNAYGAVTWGQFFVYQGFNEKTGWMHTSTYTDIKDEFVEAITKTDKGYTYKYGEEQRPVKELDVTLKYKMGDSLTEKNFTMFRTHHGPVTHAIDSNWVATAIMWDPVKALEQSFTRTKLNGHKEFREMMNMRTNSSNNTVYADAGGNIAYYHGNFIPQRNTKFDYTEPVDGSNPETDWNGLHTVDENITVINPDNGWIQNCNSTPFTSAGENSPKMEDYPNYMSRNLENFRGVHAIRLLEKANDLTLDKLIDMAYDPYLPTFEISIPGLVEAYDKSSPKDPELKEPIEVLRNWDFAVSKESVAMSLAHFYAQFYLREGNFPNGLNEMRKVAYMGSKSPTSEKLNMLRKSIAHLTKDFGTWNTPWGEISRYQRLDGDIDQKFDDDKPSIAVGLTTARWGALAAFGMRSKQKTKRIYGTRGNSFVAVVEFGDKVKAKTILAGGQSGDPNSPHFDDQAQRYVDVKFKDVPYYREDVEARAKRTYRPGEKK
ncbi:acylase [Aureibaculum sp. 2210JD6-5]|uniref:acylase n=1 Tax=Aureibaculum sp. 2210JD6-5 TaxID=3103957 RepID=UPI002AACF614|nr:acylase [Aureibaculum sp. 2210JD6-5]MDY7396125.1 acylase [Aureibaculum sp. 2210JD6-5]